jgi:MFS family permease
VNSRGLFFSKAAVFLKRQQRDWKVTVVRTSLDKFAYQIIFPYLSLYIVALGATATELGIVNSFGMIAAGVMSPLTGWFIDRSGPKKIYLLGIGFLVLSYLTYAIAQSWLITVLAMVAYWLGFSVSTHSCATICGNCLANEDRATGMTICETVAAGLLGMAGPMLGAWLVTRFGGVNVTGIRPLFFVSALISGITFAVIWTQLSGKMEKARSKTRPHIIRDLHQVLKEGQHLKRWLSISILNGAPMAMVFPFSQVFAHEIKGADPFILGAMVTGSALASIVFAIPLGRLADRVGRKRVLYLTMPLFWLSNLMLIGSTAPAFLLIAGILQGFYYIGAPIGAAMERELVPPEHMGRWLGIVRSSRMLLNALFAVLSGIIWDKIGPQYVFLAFIGLDLFLRTPLLIRMPETLRLRVGKEISEPSKGLNVS